MSTCYDLEEFFVDLPTEGITFGEVDDLLTKLREYGSAEMLHSGGKLPTHIRFVLSVGPNGIAEDLWDLRTMIDEINDALTEFRLKMGKPERMA